MTRNEDLKLKFLNASEEKTKELWERKVYSSENYYTYQMLSALRDMAKEEVWPDGRFGDMDCTIWGMFYMMKVMKGK